MSGERGRAGDAPLELVIARDAAALAALAADRIATALSDAARGVADAAGGPAARVSVALAGGRTPRAAYELLARDRRVPWDRLELFLGDERCVPPSSEPSNLCMVREALAGAADRLRPDAIHPLWTSDEPATPETLERAARAAEASLPERFDLLLLGVGADGHVASLFPGSPALREATRRVLPSRAPVAPHERLTVTPPVIAAARRLLVLVAGEDKAEAVARAMARDGPADSPPARLARRGTWVVDRAAAAKLVRS